MVLSKSHDAFTPSLFLFNLHLFKPYVQASGLLPRLVLIVISPLLPMHLAEVSTWDPVSNLPLSTVGLNPQVFNSDLGLRVGSKADLDYFPAHLFPVIPMMEDTGCGSDAYKVVPGAQAGTVP